MKTANNTLLKDGYYWFRDSPNDQWKPVRIETRTAFGHTQSAIVHDSENKFLLQSDWPEGCEFQGPLEEPKP